MMTEEMIRGDLVAKLCKKLYIAIAKDCICRRRCIMNVVFSTMMVLWKV